MLQLARDASYPLPLAASEGASTQFLQKGANFLQIAMPGISRGEATQVRNGTVWAGFKKDGPLIFWVFRFGDLIFDCPFDARLISTDERDLPNIDNAETRYFFDIHLVDSQTNVIRGLRGITLPSELTRDFLCAVEEQLADIRDTGPYLRKYHAIPVGKLPGIVRLHRCGV